MKIFGLASLLAAAVFGGLILLNTEAHSAPSRSDTPQGIEIPPPRAAAVDFRSPARAADSQDSPADNGFGCVIKPHTAADVGASAPGILSEIRIKRGDKVKRGQILAVLDSGVEHALLKAAEARAAARAEIAAARATYKMADRKVARMKSLTELSYGARLELELAEGELDVAASRVAQARERHYIAKQEHQVAESQLNQRYIRSPIDGIVADQLVNPGERTDGLPIARVIRLDMLRVEVVAPSRYYGRIAEGMTGVVSTETADPIELSAIVDQVDAFIDPASSTFRAQMLLDNSELKVPAGARCRVSFDGDASFGKRS